ncbi:uncharacterized protein LOC101760906 [Setaria italica]|uniref:uncharacterized protein LOC101760906 n=1 Tax=Setaria italica TaxID=4555 RepID=UPI000BE53546|nr:uncharacterized protein LOC101760906 [Setaria italica]
MDELIEEVLLRLPPDDPASLARAALVCRRWRRLISDPCFRRRFRSLHRPPMLGFVCNIADTDGPDISRFVPTSSFRPPRADRRDLRAIDSRHGRVLLCSQSVPRPWENGFLVWDPVADEDWEVPAPPRHPRWHWNAAVLCAADRGGGCSHIDCRRDPFLVVFRLSDHTYDEHIDDYFACAPAVLMGGALYFMFHKNTMIIKYDVATLGMSVIHAPNTFYLQNIVLMTTEDGRIELVEDSKLYLWSREADPRGVWGWTVSKVIELKSLLPADALSRSPEALGFAECGGFGFILLWTVNGFFTIDPKSNQVRNVGVTSGFKDKTR